MHARLIRSQNYTSPQNLQTAELVLCASDWERPKIYFPELDIRSIECEGRASKINGKGNDIKTPKSLLDKHLMNAFEIGRFTLLRSCPDVILDYFLDTRCQQRPCSGCQIHNS